MGVLGYLYEAHLPPHSPPCGVATTPICGVLQQIPTSRDSGGLLGGRIGRWLIVMFAIVTRSQMEDEKIEIQWCRGTLHKHRYESPLYDFFCKHRYGSRMPLSDVRRRDMLISEGPAAKRSR